MQIICELGKGLFLKELDIDDLERVRNLQANVIGALEGNDKKFLEHKSPEKIQQYLSPPNFGVGIFQNDRLVAASFLLEADPAILLHELKDVRMTQTMNERGNTGIVSGIMVHPDMRGKGFMSIMLDVLETEAIIKEYTFLMARVVEGNKASASNFDKFGFGHSGAGNHLNDRLARDIFRKRITPSLVARHKPQPRKFVLAPAG